MRVTISSALSAPLAREHPSCVLSRFSKSRYLPLWSECESPPRFVGGFFHRRNALRDSCHSLADIASYVFHGGFNRLTLCLKPVARDGVSESTTEDAYK